jgi:hypothetical protein
MYIIIKGGEEGRKRIKGKTITEFAKNLESEGWPTEFVNSEERDRIKFEERQKGRSLQKEDALKVKRTMGTERNSQYMEKLANKLGLEKFEKGYPGEKKII